MVLDRNHLLVMNGCVGCEVYVPVESECNVTIIIKLDCHTCLIIERVVVERVAAMESYSCVGVMQILLLAVTLVESALDIEPSPSGLNSAQKT